MKILVLNGGSSSIRYDLFDRDGFVLLATGLLEGIGEAGGRFGQRRGDAGGAFAETTRALPAADHREGFAAVLDEILAGGGGEADLGAVGHRVVHGGDRFRAAAVIDDGVVEGIRTLVPLAPIHNPIALEGIAAARARLPGVPQVAVFDTAFHASLPPHARAYALPQDLAERHGIRRYGFHGTSHAFVARETARHLGRPAAEISLITLHLGNGASAAAVRGGVSVDTSMGMTPLEGLVMGTRCGDLDPAVPFHLMRRGGMAPEEVEALLNRGSGLRGICGTRDMREIQDRAARGERDARLAFDLFCHRLRKYIGAYLAVLGGADAIVFTGGIGENSAPVRAAACAGLGRLGVDLDAERNAAVSGDVTEIQRPGAPVRLLVIRTDEELEIARQTVAALEDRRS